MFTTAFTISLAILGFRAITDKGMIFYFMREWLDKKSKWKKDRIEEIRKIEKRIESLKTCQATKERLKELENLNMAKTILEDDNLKKYDRLLYWMKPVILCTTCMASVHTLIWIPILGIDANIQEIIFIMLIVAFLNSILWATFELIKAIISEITD